jgi:DNA invertase Pin-like site-specific DNA recombinase
MNSYVYYRTSTATNAQSDTWARQAETCRQWAKIHGYKVAGEFREVFTGTETDRPALNDLLAEAVSADVRTIIVAGADRLSRELSVQMALIAKFKQLEINCVDAGANRSLTDQADPVTEALTLIQGVFAQLEKKRLVSKLKKARDRASETLGRRIEGRKKLYDGQDLKDRVKALRRKKPNKPRRSWEQVAENLRSKGFAVTNSEVLRRSFSNPKPRRKALTPKQFDKLIAT